MSNNPFPPAVFSVDPAALDAVLAGNGVTCAGRRVVASVRYCPAAGPTGR